MVNHDEPVSIKLRLLWKECKQMYYTMWPLLPLSDCLSVPVSTPFQHSGIAAVPSPGEPGSMVLFFLCLDHAPASSHTANLLPYLGLSPKREAEIRNRRETGRINRKRGKAWTSQRLGGTVSGWLRGRKAGLKEHSRWDAIVEGEPALVEKGPPQW